MIGVPSWKTASSRSLIVQTVISSLEVIPVAIQGTNSPFSLSRNGVPKTWVENSLLPPPSRHGAIVLRIRPTEVTTCESCRYTPDTTGLGSGRTPSGAAVAVAFAATVATGVAADWVGSRSVRRPWESR